MFRFTQVIKKYGAGAIVLEAFIFCLSGGFHSKIITLSIQSQFLRKQRDILMIFYDQFNIDRYQPISMTRSYSLFITLPRQLNNELKQLTQFSTMFSRKLIKSFPSVSITLQTIVSLLDDFISIQDCIIYKNYVHAVETTPCGHKTTIGLYITLYRNRVLAWVLHSLQLKVKTIGLYEGHMFSYSILYHIPF